MGKAAGTGKAGMIPRLGRSYQHPKRFELFFLHWYAVSADKADITAITGLWPVTPSLDRS